MPTYWHILRLFSREARLYLVTAALIGLTVFGGIYPALLNLYLRRLGYDLVFIGLVNAAGLSGVAIFSLPAGVAAKRWGVRRLMIIGLGLMVTGYGATALAELIPAAWQKGWLLTTYMLGGLGLALYIVNTSPFLMSATGSTERQHVFSVQAALWPLAGFVGSLLGGFLPGVFAGLLGTPLTQPAPYRYPLFIAALLLIPAILAMVVARDIDPTKQQVATVDPAQPPLLDTAAFPFAVIAVMMSVGLLRLAGEGSMRTFLNVYLDADLGVSTALIGALLALGQLLAVPAALFAPLAVARWGYQRTIVGGSLGITLSLLPVAFIPHWSAGGLGFMSVMVLTAIVRPAFTVYSQEIVPPNAWAIMSGATAMAAGLSWSLVAFGGGYLVEALGYRSLFLSGAILSAAGGGLFWAYFRTPRGEFARRRLR